MTRHEAVEEGEKTHTELVLAARQGGQREAAFAPGGPAACLLEGGSGMEQMGHVGGCRAQGEGEHTDEPADVRADAMRVSQREDTILPGPMLRRYSEKRGNFSATMADSLRPKDSYHGLTLSLRTGLFPALSTPANPTLHSVS